MMKTVLIAEDDSFLARTIAAALQDHGQESSIACNGEEAIAAMDKKQPELMLLDLLMPKVDGHAVLEHYRNKGYTFPVIILSNLSDDINRSHCLEMGAADYYIKSNIDENSLGPLVEKYLKK